MSGWLRRFPWLKLNRRGAPQSVAGNRGSAHICVLTVTDVEFEEVKATFESNQNVQGTPYFVRRLTARNEYDLVVRKISDRGNLAVQNAVRATLEDWRPPYLLLLGTAGGIGGRDDLGLGDVVIADFVIYNEFQKIVPGKALTRYMPFDQPSHFMRTYFAEPLMYSEWQAAIRCDRPTAGKPKAIPGHIVSGDKFLADPSAEFVKDTLEKWDNALAVDMESAGVARQIFESRGSVHYNPQYLVVRGISDLVNAPHEDIDLGHAWRRYAAASAACFGLDICRALLSQGGS